MAILDPALVPADRRHLDDVDRQRFELFDRLVAEAAHEEAHDVLEDLWIEATDVHKALYKGLANALAAVCAREQGHRRGAVEIARRSREMLAPFPREVVGLDLSLLLASVDDIVAAGAGNLRLHRDA